MSRIQLEADARNFCVAVNTSHRALHVNYASTPLSAAQLFRGTMAKGALTPVGEGVGE